MAKTARRPRAAKGMPETEFKIGPLPLPSITSLAQGDTIDHLWWALHTRAQRLENASRQFAEAREMHRSFARPVTGETSTQRNFMRAQAYGERDHEDAGRYSRLVHSFPGVNAIETHCIDRFGEFSAQSLRRLAAQVATKHQTVIRDIFAMMTADVAAMLGGKKTAIDESDGGQRPAYDRDHDWLDWYEVDGLSAAQIRAKFNLIDDTTRQQNYGICWQKIPAATSGTRRIETALHAAAKDLNRERMKRGSRKK